MRRLVVVTLAVGCVVFSLGCAEQDPPVVTPYYGGDPGVGGDTHSGDTPMGDTHAGDPGSSAGGQGVIYAMSGSYIAWHTSSLQVSFGPHRAADPNCSVVDAGSCSKTTCISGGATRPDAGTITVSGGLQTPIASADSHGLYTVSELDKEAALFNISTTLSVTAAGGDVPAFSESLVTPAAITVNSPTFNAGAITVDTSSDLSVTWSGGSTGEVLLVAGGIASSSGSTVIMYCRYPASAGSGTVPASIIDSFSNVDANGVLAIGLATVNEITIGEWDVRILAHQIAAGGGASLGFAAGLADYQ